MITVDQVHSWSPRQLSAAADEMAADRRALLGLQDELDAARPPDDWIGKDADAARVSHRRV